MTQQNQKHYKLLSNFPCGEDRFEGHSHERIATHIADVIRHNSSCRIIGIEGGWGSGKSNLVKLVEKDLSSTDQEDTYKFFIYDAWGHITDIQRRSILEELTEFLKGDLQPIDEWERKVEQLLSKSKTTIERDIPKLNGFLSMVIIIILTSPILHRMVEFISQRWLDNSVNGIILELLIYAFMLCIGYQWNRDQRRFDPDAKDDEGTDLLSDLFSLYSKKVSSTTKYEQIQEKEPTSQQFRDWIQKIDESLPEKEVVVLVFDNMDRLPQHKVQEFWAAIHSFFSTDSKSSLKKIKVLIPFDRQHVQDAFKKANESESYGDDFINKTFNVIYRVPPIILTQWKSYFSEMWQEAFGYEAPSEVTQIFDALQEKKTPREMIAFINKCVTIKEISEEIPDKYIALFIFGLNKISSKPTAEILKPSFLKSLSFLYEHDRDLPKFLSALYYQLPEDQAVDVVMVTQLVRDLDNNNVSSYTIDENNEDFVLRLLEAALPRITNVENAVKAFGALNLKESQHKDFLWSCICESALANDSVSVYKPYQKEIFKHTSDKGEYFHKLINCYRENINKFEPSDYKTAVDELSTVDNETVKSILQSSPYILPEKEFLEYLRILKGKYETYGITFDQPKLDDYLGKLDVGELSKVSGINFLVSKEEDVKKTFPNYLSNLGKLIAQSASNSSNLFILYNRIKEVERPMQNTFWLDNDQLSSLFGSMNRENPLYYDLVSMRIAKLNSFNPSYNRNAFDNILNSSDENDVKRLADIIEYYIDYSDLLINCRTMHSKLMIAVAKELTLHPRGVSRMDVTSVLTNFKEVLSATGIEDKELFNRLNGWEQHYLELDLDQIPEELFSTALVVDNELSGKLKQTVRNIFAKANQEEWKEAILKENKLLSFWLEFHPSNVQNCFDAFKQLLKEAANGDEDSSIDKDTITKLLTIFASLGNDIEYLMNEIFDILKSKHTKVHLLYYGKWILEYCSKVKLKGFLNDLVPTDIIDENVVKFLFDNPKILSSRKPKGFNDKLLQIYSNQMSDYEPLKEYLLSQKLIEKK